MKTRTKAYLVRLTDEEFAFVTEQAQRTLLSREEYTRKSILGKTINEAPPADVPQLIREIRRVGQNVNQLLLIANNFGERDPILLAETMKDVQAALSTVIKAYTEEE